ncbi:PTS galactitol transporter subunit IIA [Vibrio parahaemolyticus]|uniref:PTS galactitol transporter subunit IIA n=1 Tax=Vibrio parahaemolyticus TaxID=670 RepID=UPI00111ED065|nr:PTS galactitol transporter subunit IIA [Vibrio parahaemolyticus]MBM4862716.1 PTS galactitol transporter subunit IIA [Vibrio parahaemolyticus]MBM4952074.1 PTS galactitol transporter subunit IIA [Vibrio parahaemolyticus]MDA0386403.1 PTS galactitol transporter subunit IIA [Vibrio parahaemolyticus]MDA0390948.1 PTS galactitol transporter subunit IIA [Vibrio parahaemolyticus]MDA0396247.1 PTS galactitol transporter subunit IIA [Vibrio parahaemolyticus]
MNSQLLVNIDIELKTYQDVLNHISNRLIQEEFVKESYDRAIRERESLYPTGVDLGFGAVAIPHCDASHANKPCVYLIKPNKPVVFNSADGDEEVNAEIIMALVVTNPEQQMTLLRSLFSSLQDEEFYNELKNAETEESLTHIFNSKILNTEKVAA